MRGHFPAQSFMSRFRGGSVAPPRNLIFIAAV
jgi:hypothetical protein